MRLPEVLLVLLMVLAGAFASPYLAKDISDKQKSDWYWSGCTDGYTEMILELQGFIKPDEEATLAARALKFCNDKADVVEKRYFEGDTHERP